MLSLQKKKKEGVRSSERRTLWTHDESCLRPQRERVAACWRCLSSVSAAHPCSVRLCRSQRQQRRGHAGQVRPLSQVSRFIHSRRGLHTESSFLDLFQLSVWAPLQLLYSLWADVDAAVTSICRSCKSLNGGREQRKRERKKERAVLIRKCL